MIFKRSLFLVLVLVSMNSAAFELQEEHIAEITSRWQAIWSEQLEGVSDVTDMRRYAQELLNLQPKDTQVAEQMMMGVCQGDAWENFWKHKDLESTYAFITYMNEILKRLVWSESELDFPPKLSEVADEIKRSGLPEGAYLTRLRQSLLAFTLIVSHMNYLCNVAASE